MDSKKPFTCGYSSGEVLHNGSSHRIQASVFKCKWISLNATLSSSSVVIYSLSGPSGYFQFFYLASIRKEDKKSPQGFKYSLLEDQEQFWNRGLDNIPIIHNLNDSVQHQLLNVKVICGISILSKMAPAVSMVSPEICTEPHC